MLRFIKVRFQQTLKPGIKKIFVNWHNEYYHIETGTKKYAEKDKYKRPAEHTFIFLLD